MMKVIKKKLMGYWNLICPFCNIDMKYPNSTIEKMVNKHWGKGFTFREAYLEVFKKRNQETKKIGQ